MNVLKSVFFTLVLVFLAVAASPAMASAHSDVSSELLAMPMTFMDSPGGGDAQWDRATPLTPDIRDARPTPFLIHIDGPCACGEPGSLEQLEKLYGPGFSLIELKDPGYGVTDQCCNGVRSRTKPGGYIPIGTLAAGKIIAEYRDGTVEVDFKAKVYIQRCGWQEMVFDLTLHKAPRFSRPDHQEIARVEREVKERLKNVEQDVDALKKRSLLDVRTLASTNVTKTGATAHGEVVTTKNAVCKFFGSADKQLFETIKSTGTFDSVESSTLAVFGDQSIESETATTTRKFSSPWNFKEPNKKEQSVMAACKLSDTDTVAFGEPVTVSFEKKGMSFGEKAGIVGALVAVAAVVLSQDGGTNTSHKCPDGSRWVNGHCQVIDPGIPPPTASAVAGMMRDVLLGKRRPAMRKPVTTSTTVAPATNSNISTSEVETIAPAALRFPGLETIARSSLANAAQPTGGDRFLAIVKHIRVDLDLGGALQGDWRPTVSAGWSW